MKRRSFFDVIPPVLYAGGSVVLLVGGTAAEAAVLFLCGSVASLVLVLCDLAGL